MVFPEKQQEHDQGTAAVGERRKDNLTVEQRLPHRGKSAESAGQRHLWHPKAVSAPAAAPLWRHRPEEWRHQAWRGRRRAGPTGPRSTSRHRAWCDGLTDWRTGDWPADWNECWRRSAADDSAGGLFLPRGSGGHGVAIFPKVSAGRCGHSHDLRHSGAIVTCCRDERLLSDLEVPLTRYRTQVMRSQTCHWHTHGPWIVWRMQRRLDSCIVQVFLWCNILKCMGVMYAWITESLGHFVSKSPANMESESVVTNNITNNNNKSSPNIAGQGHSLLFYEYSLITSATPSEDGPALFMCHLFLHQSTGGVSYTTNFQVCPTNFELCPTNLCQIWPFSGFKMTIFHRRLAKRSGPKTFLHLNSCLPGFPRIAISWHGILPHQLFPKSSTHASICWSWLHWHSNGGT